MGPWVLWASAVRVGFCSEARTARGRLGRLEAGARVSGRGVKDARGLTRLILRAAGRKRQSSFFRGSRAFSLSLSAFFLLRNSVRESIGRYRQHRCSLSLREEGGGAEGGCAAAGGPDGRSPGGRRDGRLPGAVCRGACLCLPFFNVFASFSRLSPSSSSQTHSQTSDSLMSYCALNLWPPRGPCPTA